MHSRRKSRRVVSRWRVFREIRPGIRKTQDVLVSNFQINHIREIPEALAVGFAVGVLDLFTAICGAEEMYGQAENLNGPIKWKGSKCRR